MCIYLCVYIQFQKHEYKLDRYTHIYKYTLSYISIYIYYILTESRQVGWSVIGQFGFRLVPRVCKELRQPQQQSVTARQRRCLFLGGSS